MIPIKNSFIVTVDLKKDTQYLKVLKQPMEGTKIKLRISKNEKWFMQILIDHFFNIGFMHILETILIRRRKISEANNANKSCRP